MLISPFLVRSKVIIQEVWKLKIDWDEVIPEAICLPWQSWLYQFTEIPNIKVDCWTGLKARGTSYQLHTFCDASEEGVCAAVYIRVKSGADITTNLLAAKSRVSPLKANRSRDLNSSPASSLFDSVQLSKRLIRQLLKTHSFGPTARSASGGSALLPNRSKLTSLIEWEKSKLSPSLVNGFTCLESSIRPTSELVRFRSPNFAIVRPGGRHPNFSGLTSLNGQKRRLSKSLRTQANDFSDNRSSEES